LIIGINIGRTTTCLVGYDGESIINPITVKADDPIASAAGALGKFLSERKCEPRDIECIALAGTGSEIIGDNLLGFPVRYINEFEAIGRGGAFLSNIPKAVVVSMGTGTAMVEVDADTIRHWGGSGIGGGTLVGLSKYILGITDISLLIKKAEKGRLNKVDLSVGDIATSEIIGLPDTITASNFGKCSDDATEDDLALAIIFLVYQTIGIIAGGAARATDNSVIILTGRLATLRPAKRIFDDMAGFSGLKYVIPRLAGYSTAVGASISIDFTPDHGD
jgi:type II pantothenate kinase